jgi:hypothetical protein
MKIKLFVFCLLIFLFSQISSIRLGFFKDIKSLYSSKVFPNLDLILLNKGINNPINSFQTTKSKNKNLQIGSKLLEIAEIPEHLQEIRTLSEILNLIQTYEESLNQREMSEDDEYELEEL